jgi:DNA mismatch repair ATPase MutS
MTNFIYILQSLFFKRTTPRKVLSNTKEDYFNFNLIETYFKKKTHSHSFQVMDDHFINDVDFHELFMFMDRTHSKIGQQYLYDQILSINSNIDFTQQEQLIDYFAENEKQSFRVQTLLSKLNRRESYYICNLFFDEYIPKPNWFWIIKVFSFAGLIAGASVFLLSKYTILFFLLVYITNLSIHYWNKRNIMIYMDSIPQLPLFCKIAKEFVLMDIIPNAKSSVLHSITTINEMKPIIGFFKFNSGIKSEIEAVLLVLWEAVKILLLIEPIVIFTVFKRLENKKNDIQTIFEYIGKVDSAISIATIRKEVPYFCKPTLLKSHNYLSFTNIYHPLIPDCVTNSIEIKDKSILLTGSNMSGKTSFIRTVAINTLLGQTINTCFAETFQLSHTQLFSVIRVSDDLLNDKSYYFEEVLIIKNMIMKSFSSTNNIFFLDEIFKGTNTIERIAAGKAILSFLAKSKNNIVFVSTHDIELTDFLCKEYDLYHFTEFIKDNNIYFDYKLKLGNLYKKNAIRILEINDYPEEIIKDAKSIIQVLEKKPY